MKHVAIQVFMNFRGKVINWVYPQTVRTPAELPTEEFMFSRALNPKAPACREWGTR